MIKFYNFIIHSNLFISVAALSLYLFYSLKSNYNFSIATMFFVLGGTYFSYHLLRFIPFKKGFFVEEPIVTFYKNHNLYLYGSILISSIFIFIGLQAYEHINFTTVVLCLVITLLYEKILTNKFELRAIPYLKSLLIALVWSFMATKLNSDSAELFDTIECFIFILLLTLPFELKDLASDIKQNIKSFPTVLKDKFKIILCSLYFIYAIFYYLQTAEAFLLVSIPIYFGSFYLSKKNSLWYYLGFDGLIILRLIIYTYQY
ncbi:MAG: hypothetical protein HON90_07050 [Halobacteriovoraceae bacterium]|nr:hypothetical protein [Halobacteriovoraceae bacterium]